MLDQADPEYFSHGRTIERWVGRTLAAAMGHKSVTLIVTLGVILLERYEERTAFSD